MTNFYFRAVASDGQIRTGAIHAESERLVAFELRRQGLTPVYVGKEAKSSVEIKLPSFSGGRKRDVLFFTQEISTLLSAGVPVDRALGILGDCAKNGEIDDELLKIFVDAKVYERTKQAAGPAAAK